MMKKVKTLQILVVVLILLNLSFLVFHFFIARPHHPDPNGIKERIKKELHFNQEQAKDYEKLVKIHQQAMRKLEKEKAKTKYELYLMLEDKSQVSDKQKELLAYLGNLQIEIERTHYNHFEDIYKLCKPEQEHYFKKLQKKIAELFDMQGPPRKMK